MASLAERQAAARADHRFYVWMAVAFTATGFLGFIPTYWARLATGSFAGNPITHIHGMLFFGWTLTWLVQTSLVARGNTAMHRRFGIFGVALFSAMMCTVLLAVLNEIRVYDALGVGDATRRFVSVPLVALASLVGLFTLALMRTGQPAVHKRLMILTMAPMSQAAIARWFQYFLSPPGAVGAPPVFLAVPPGVLSMGFIIAGAIHDKRTTGHVHRVYKIGGPLMFLLMLLPVPLSATSGWMSFVYALERLAP